MVRQHHPLKGHGFGQTLGDSGRQKSLVDFSPWGQKESAQLRDCTTINQLSKLRGYHTSVFQ